MDACGRAKAQDASRCRQQLERDCKDVSIADGGQCEEALVQSTSLVAASNCSMSVLILSKLTHLAHRTCTMQSLRKTRSAISSASLCALIREKDLADCLYRVRHCCRPSKTMRTTSGKSSGRKWASQPRYVQDPRFRFSLPHARSAKIVQACEQFAKEQGWKI